MGLGGGGWVGKCVSKENPKSDLDLDLGLGNKSIKKDLWGRREQV